MARKKGPQIDQAYQHIMKKIYNYELKPGDVISDNAIAEELNMSRTPVREAIVMLSADGLIESINYKTCVSAFGLKDIVDSCVARGAIERASVELIAEHGGLLPAQKEALHEQFTRMQTALRCGDYDAFNDADNEFHYEIVKFSDNSTLLDVTKRISLQVQRTHALNKLFVLNRNQAALDEHYAIYDNLVNNRIDACCKTIQTHIRNSIASLQGLFQDDAIRSAVSCLQSLY